MPFVKITKDDWNRKDLCTHPEHNPPNMMVYKDGTYTWRCPVCGHEQTFTVRNPRL